MFDVGDPALNAVLNLCFGAIALLTVAAIIPWKAAGADRVHRLLRWIAVLVFALAVLYEWLMPLRFDIRVDLLLLLPMYAVVIGTSLVRWGGGSSNAIGFQEQLMAFDPDLDCAVPRDSAQ